MGSFCFYDYPRCRGTGLEPQKQSGIKKDLTVHDEDSTQISSKNFNIPYSTYKEISRSILTLAVVH